MIWPLKFSRFSTVDLDANWRNIDYCSIDLETTGLDLREDEIISMGAVQIHQGRIMTENNFYREVRPRRLPSLTSVQVHGLRAVDLETAGPIELTIPDFLAQITNRVIIAHAAWVEEAFLRPVLRGAGLTFPKQIIDTAALARAFGYATDDVGHEPSLELIARRLHLPVYAPHNALGDALTTAVVFLALATEFERTHIAKGASTLSLRELLKTSAKTARR